MRIGYSYIARCKCGEIVGAVVDDPDSKRSVAKEVQSWIREGCTVERVTSDVVRSSHWGCKCAEIEARRQPSLFEDDEL